MSIFRLISRLILALVLAGALLVVLTLLAYYVGWYFYGLSGHPALPDVSAEAYLAYYILAPLLCLGCGFWMVFRRGKAH